ncbi:MAG: LD-carboxypeptidase [Polyangiaceae bacterium]|nr:LD-carboxypeptidase [Polyangiaceae bacterium]
MILPPPLEPGARVRVIAPSSPFDRALVYRGLSFLAQRYQVLFEPEMFEKEGYLAGNDDRRLGELNRALRDPEARAIVAARGGYGASRVSFRADFAALRHHPKWLVGFSDFTALHVEAARVGVMSLHAHNAAGLGRHHVKVWQPWVSVLEAAASPRTLTGTDVVAPGRGQGTLVGGNLTVWFTAWAAGRVRLPEAFVLALEDVGEATYRLDRMLMALRAAGVFDGCRGIALGEFTDCTPGKFGVSLPQMFRQTLGGLKLPILGGLPFGHGAQNEPLILGGEATLDTAALTLRIAASG